MWYTIFLPILRHFIAASLAGVVTWLVSQGMDPEEVSAVIAALAGFGVAMAFGIYSLTEKSLKPLFRKWFGEVGTGDIPVIVEDTLKAKGDIPS